MSRTVLLVVWGLLGGCAAPRLQDAPPRRSEREPIAHPIELDERPATLVRLRVERT